MQESKEGDDAEPDYCSGMLMSPRFQNVGAGLCLTFDGEAPKQTEVNLGDKSVAVWPLKDDEENSCQLLCETDATCYGYSLLAKYINDYHHYLQKMERRCFLWQQEGLKAGGGGSWHMASCIVKQQW